MIQDRLDIQLERVADRYRRLSYWYSLAAVWLIASVVVLLLVSGGLRFDIHHLPAPSRANIAVLCLAVVGIVFSSVKSLVRAPNHLTVAQRIEQKFPELDSALLAAIEQAPALSDGRYGFLQQAVIEQALAHAQSHPWTQVVSRTRIGLAATLQFAMLALLCSCAMLTLLPSKPSLAKKGEKRSAVQGGEFAVSIEPGNTEVEKGTSLLVLARVQGPLPADATLVFGTSSGEPTRLAMSPSLDDPVYGGRVPVVNQPLEYHVKLDDHLTPTYRVSVFEYPRLERADARLVYPSYTGMEQRLIQDIRTMSVVEGTEVTLICQLNKRVKSARFIENPAASKGTRDEKTVADKANAAADPSLPELPLIAREGNVYEVKFKAAKTRRLKLELIDEADRRNTEQALIVIQVVPNQPPTFKLAFPGRDLEVSPLEELNVNATAWDDYGIQRAGISFGLAGQPATEVVLGQNVAARQRHELANIIRFEDLHAEPDQLLAYYFWAEDFDADGKLRKTSSDMYFAEVRHFDEIFREGQQPAGGQQRPQSGNQNTQAAQQLAQLQKDIMNATWKVIRRETEATQSPPFVEDVKQIAQSQTDALEQASKLSESIQDVESQGHLLTVLESMQRASQHLKLAHEKPAIPELQPALAAEQAAYQALLKLRAREHQVIRQQQSSSASSSQAGRSQQQRQQMEQLDLKDEEKRYEDQRLAQAQQEKPEDRETRQVLNRLRELARRQHDLNERLKDLQSALQEAKDEAKKEEIRQQLKRLQDEQREVLRDTDELQSRMEAPENQERMAEERQQLEQARDQVQRASKSLENDQVTQAAASGTRAEKEFDELRNEFRKRASGRFNEEMREMRDAARDLDQKEQELAEKLAALGAGATEPKKKSLRDEDSQSGPIADSLNKQKEQLGNLSERLKKTVEEAEQTEPLLTERLADAARNLTDQNVERALEAAGRSARQGLLDDAREVEKIAGRGITQLRQGIEKAAESVLGDETEALRRAREQLKNLSQELNQEIARNAPDEKLPTAADRQSGEANDSKQSDQSGDREANAGAGRESEQDPNGNSPPGKGKSRPTPGDRSTPEGQAPQSEAADSQPEGDQPAGGQSNGGQPRDAGKPNGETPPMPGEQGKGQPGAANGESGEDQPREGGGPMPSGQDAGQERGPNGQPMPSRQRGQQQGQQPGQNSQRSGQRGSRGDQPGPNQAGLGEGNGIAEGGGEEQAAPISGNDFLNWSDRLRDVEEMVDDPELRAEAARIRDQARSIRADLKRHSKEPNWKLVRASVAEPLVELSNRVAEELLRRNSKQAIVPLDRDPVPPKYSEKTRRYYERLGSGQ